MQFAENAHINAPYIKFLIIFN
jgi:cell division cycle 14